MATATRRPHRLAAVIAGVAASWFLRPALAATFPLDNTLTPSIVPAGGELAPPDAQELRHQMGLVSGFAAMGGGWTIIPSLGVYETLNDNVFQAHSPRRADLITTIVPGVTIASHTPRIQLELSYQPNLQIHAKFGSENVLTHQLSAVGEVTLVPDQLFVDIRGLAGVQATAGGVGGVGSVGGPTLAPVSANNFLQTNQAGVTRQSLVQASSFAVSPYLLQRFGDAGTARFGLSLNETSFSQISGFTAAPWATGPDAQRQTGIDENASFQTGNILSRTLYTVSVNAGQSYYTSAGRAGSSDYEQISNRVDYALYHSVVVYVQLGWERIVYTGSSLFNLNGPTWGFGTTLTPSQDTSLTLGYRHQEGSSSFVFNGRYAVSAFTTLTGSYDSGIGTQTGFLTGQLNAATVSSNGSLVSSQTGGTLFASTNALGVQPGLYRFTALSLQSTTVLPRDTITLTISHSTQTPIGSGVRGVATEATTGGVSWTHELSPNLTMSAAAYYSLGTPSGSIRQNSIAAGVSGQYRLSETVSSFARYAYYQRQAASSALSMYQDLFLVGITKQF